MTDELTYPSDSGPDYEWIPNGVHTIVTDANMTDWERDGKQIVMQNIEKEFPNEEWVHAYDSDSWVDLVEVR